MAGRESFEDNRETGRGQLVKPIFLLQRDNTLKKFGIMRRVHEFKSTKVQLLELQFAGGKTRPDDLKHSSQAIRGQNAARQFELLELDHCLEQCGAPTKTMTRDKATEERERLQGAVVRRDDGLEQGLKLSVRETTENTDRTKQS